MQRELVLLIVLAASTSGSSAASDEFRRAEDALRALQADYSRLPICSELTDVTSMHREALRSALADVHDTGVSDVLGSTPVEYAVVADDLASVRRFVAMGYPLTQKDGALLFTAAMYATAPMLEYLLSQHVDVNATNDYAATALMVAASVNRSEIVRFLLKHGANPGARDRDGGSALSYSLACGYTESARVLLDGGATVDEKAIQVATKTGALDALNRHLPAPAGK
jgi:hypothetical protein